MQTSAGRAEYQCKRSLFYSDRIFCKRAFSSARRSGERYIDFVILDRLPHLYILVRILHILMPALNGGGEPWRRLSRVLLSRLYPVVNQSISWSFCMDMTATSDSYQSRAQLGAHHAQAEFLAAEPGLARDGVPSGRQWFDMADTSPAKMIKGVKTVAPLLDNFSTKCLPNAAPRVSSCARRLFARRDARTTCGAPAPNANGSDRGVFWRGV